MYDFFSLELTVPLPANFVDWLRIGYMYSKWTTIIPSKYAPIDVIAIGEDINYNYPIGTTYAETINQAQFMATSPSIVGAATGINLLASALAAPSDIVTYRRKDRTGFYFQIGDLKHQA